MLYNPQNGQILVILVSFVAEFFQGEQSLCYRMEIFFFFLEENLAWIEYVHMYVCMYACMHAYMYVCMYACMYVCICMFHEMNQYN